MIDMRDITDRLYSGYDATADDMFIDAVREIERLRAELAQAHKALYRIIELDHHNMGPESKATKIARAALKEF